MPIALGILCASEQIPKGLFKDHVVMGELSLDGKLRPIKGVLSMTIKAKQMGMKGIIVPEPNLEEAQLVKGIKIIGANNLKELILHFQGKKEIINYKKTFFSKKE